MAITPTGSKQTWVQTLGAKHCLAVANGTSALITSLAALGVGPGDEVIVPPYTFVATINAVLMHHAIPIFVDTDPETFQIDARKLESALTEQTACIIPVHLGGSAADMDTILAVAAKHKVPVVEDACQAHLAEWRNKKVSTLGDLGCFSFQASKNLNSGEGGAILTNSDKLYEECRSFQNNGRSAPGSGFCLRPQRGQPPDDRVSGGSDFAAVHPPRSAVAPPRAERGLPHRPAPRSPGHHTRPDVRRLHAQRVSSLYVSVRFSGF